MLQTNNNSTNNYIYDAVINNIREAGDYVMLRIRHSACQQDFSHTWLDYEWYLGKMSAPENNSSDCQMSIKCTFCTK